MIAKALDLFIEKRPAATMFRAMLSRIFSDDALEEIFREHRTKQVDSPILFSYLVHMLTPVVAGDKQVNCSHRDLGLSVSRQAIYDKLKGVEPEVSTSLVRETADQLRQIYDILGVRHADIIPGYHTYVIDGKTLDKTEHRLKEFRTDSRAPLPGRCVALLDTRYELFVDVESDPNALRCERKIFEHMLPRIEKRAVYMADRNFSDSNLLEGIIKSQAYFIVRLHKASPSWREIPGTNKKTNRRKDRMGGTVSERDIEIDLPENGWTRVRLITVRLAKKTRNGDRVLRIITNMPRSVGAIQISTAYSKRWNIETCFGYLSQCLNAEIRTLAYPAAAGLCFSLALVIFNILSSIKSVMTKFAKQPNPDKPIEISYYYLAREIASCYEGLCIAVEEKQWQQIAQLPIKQFAQWLKRVAQFARLAKYAKNPRGPKKPPPKRKFSGARHVATQKVLEARQ